MTPINTATNKPGKPITVGKYPDYIAITPNGKTAYVSNEGPGTVTPISTATNKPGTAITGLGGPIAITPDGNTVYAASSHDTVTLVRTATNKPGNAIEVGRYPITIAITP